jgi:hypothetical protein
MFTPVCFICLVPFGGFESVFCEHGVIGRIRYAPTMWMNKIKGKINDIYKNNNYNITTDRRFQLKRHSLQAS